MKQIVLFNNKGGVGKTTFLLHLGFALEQQGKKVLFVDADPQCNLTAYLCNDDTIDTIWRDNRSIYSAVKPIIIGTGDITEIIPYHRPGRNIWLIPGDVSLSEFEENLSRAYVDALAGRELGFRVTSALYRLIRRVAEANDIDYVLVDVGPNLGSLNRSILLGCDYFIVPLIPDLFSLRGLENIGGTFKRWIVEWRGALDRYTDRPFSVQAGTPTFAGYVVQQFNIYRQRETQAWQRWTERVPSAIMQNIVENLRAIDQNLVLDLNGGTFKIGDVRNYHSLAPMSHTNRKPIFELTSEDGAIGAHAATVRECGVEYNRLAALLIGRL